jgi:hypothetical protein
MANMSKFQRYIALASTRMADPDIVPGSMHVALAFILIYFSFDPVFNKVKQLDFSS